MVTNHLFVEVVMIVLPITPTMMVIRVTAFDIKQIFCVLVDYPEFDDVGFIGDG